MAEAADFQGMSLSCPPVAAADSLLLAGAPLLAGLLRLPRPRRAGAGASTLPTRLAHRRCVPGHPHPQRAGEGDTLTISGTVINKGKQTITDAHVDLRVGPTLTAGRPSTRRPSAPAICPGATRPRSTTSTR